MLRFALPLVAIVLSSPAHANEAVDRFEAAWVTYYTKLFGTVTDNVPDLSWDDGDRQAGTCMLVAVADQAGANGMTTFIRAYENAAARNYSSQSEAVSALEVNVPGLTAASLELITRSCGMLERLQARLGG